MVVIKTSCIYKPVKRMKGYGSEQKCTHTRIKVNVQNPMEVKNTTRLLIVSVHVSLEKEVLLFVQR